jgi:hypothetical protein
MRRNRGRCCEVLSFLFLHKNNVFKNKFYIQYKISRKINWTVNLDERELICMSSEQRPEQIRILVRKARIFVWYLHYRSNTAVNKTGSFSDSWSSALLGKPSQHFMEPEGPLPCSQEPSTGPCPEPYQSNPYHPISLRPILILPTHLRVGLPSG